MVAAAHTAIACHGASVCLQQHLDLDVFRKCSQHLLLWCRPFLYPRPTVKYTRMFGASFNSKVKLVLCGSGKMGVCGDRRVVF